ncbi:Insulin enhancer protein, partial [Schistosoma japonicum]
MMSTALTIKYEADFSNQENKIGTNFRSDAKQYIELDDKMINSAITVMNDTNMKYSTSSSSSSLSAAGTVEFTPLSLTTTTSSSLSSALSQCVGCGLIIYDPFMLNVQPNLKWHIRCLNCSKCLRSLMNDSTCFVRDCKAYCREDYFSTFLYRCAGCYRLIDKMDLVFRIRSRTFHLDCFRCNICEKLLQPGEEIAYRNEQVYCLIHSHLIQKMPKINHSPHPHHHCNNNNYENNNDTTTGTTHIDDSNNNSNVGVETLQFMSNNHFINNINSNDNNNNNDDNTQINTIGLHCMNQSLIDQAEINNTPSINLITKTTTTTT